MADKGPTDTTTLVTYFLAGLGAAFLFQRVACGQRERIYVPVRVKETPDLGESEPATAPLSSALGQTEVGEELGPVSTPSSLGNRHGLGGAPFVGSQSTKLGGSKIKPYASFHKPILRDNVSEWRAPKEPTLRPAVKSKTLPKPRSLPKTPATKALTKVKAWDPTAQIVDSRNGETIIPR